MMRRPEGGQQGFEAARRSAFNGGRAAGDWAEGAEEAFGKQEERKATLTSMLIPPAHHRIINTAEARYHFD